MKPTARQEGGNFADALTATNLERLWVISLAGTALSLAVLLLNLFLVGWQETTRVGTLDVLGSAALIVSVAVLRRRPRRGRWPRVFVAAVAALWLGSLDLYYFSALATRTHNASYAIGVMGAAVFFLLPPAVFLPLLGLNHAFYCARLLQFSATSGRDVWPPLIDGTVVMAVAALASWLLFRAARGNFEAARIIGERNRALVAANAELREVMAIAAHDMRSPLLGVRDLLVLARREPAATGTLARILDQAAETCGAMTRLLARLIEAHAAEDAHARLVLARQDLRVACSAAVDRLGGTAAGKQQRVALVLPATEAPAAAEGTALGQLLDNLLGNALKFSPPGTAVELALAATEDGAAWRIAVSDEGPGIPADEVPDLWKKFHRASPRPTGGETSTGMGLFIVKRLAEAMGGRVSHAPRPGGGSVFAVELPRVS